MEYSSWSRGIPDIYKGENPELIAQSILTHGTFFNPAWKHYGSSELVVSCDRCHMSNIPVCIGWGKYDYCLSCVKTLTDNENKKRSHDDDTMKRETQSSSSMPSIKDIWSYFSAKPQSQQEMTFMEQDIFGGRKYLTKMEQEIYQRMPTTNMESTMYHRSISEVPKYEKRFVAEMEPSMYHRNISGGQRLDAAMEPTMYQTFGENLPPHSFYSR